MHSPRHDRQSGWHLQRERARAKRAWSPRRHDPGLQTKVRVTAYRQHEVHAQRSTMSTCSLSACTPSPCLCCFLKHTAAACTADKEPDTPDNHALPATQCRHVCS
jgi:hypothetical protein